MMSCASCRQAIPPAEAHLPCPNCGSVDRNVEMADSAGTDAFTGADQSIRELLAQGSESRVDYKSARSAPSDARGWAKLAKHVIGLSNRKDGGYLLIGVEDGTLQPVGLTDDQVATWDAARVNTQLAQHAAPRPVVQVIRGSLEDGKVLCSRCGSRRSRNSHWCAKTVTSEQGRPIIREGALYIRTEGTETREVAEAEMRELLSRAYVKRAERLLYVKALIDVHWPGGGAPAAPGVVSAIERDLEEMRRP
jgi:predicted HTH transcriptional regulator